MKAVQWQCSVPHMTATGIPRVIVAEGGRTYHLSREVDRFLYGGKWWLGEPTRTVWVLECGQVMMEVCRFDREWNGSQWWVMRIQD